MKLKSLLYGAALMVAVAPSMAQVPVVITDVESGIIPWTATSGYVGSTWMNDGGADGTANYIRLTDNGWGAGWDYADAATPTAGKYKLQFWYRNGVADAAMKSLTVSIVQDGATKVSTVLSDAVVTDWTVAESEIVDLTGNAVTLSITNQQSATADVTADLDQIVLVPIVGNAPLELEVWPTGNIYLSGTETITASPKFGTESYTKVEFDINADGSVEHTDTSAPFEYIWDTTDQVSDGTSRTLDVDTSNTPLSVKVTVTASDSETASVTEDYTVDNRFDGRVSLITNGDFSQWQDPDSSGNTLPVGWVEQNITATMPTYGPGAGRTAEAGDSLRVTMTNAPGGEDPFPDRYALRTVGVQGNYHDLQTYFWGQGPYCRLMYMLSDDGGITYSTTQQSAGESNSNTWKFAVQETPKNLGLTDQSYISLGTHQLGTDDNFWDDIVSKGILYPESSAVGEWKLY